MKRALTLLVLFLVSNSTNQVFASDSTPEFNAPLSIDLELFLLRKGSSVSIVIVSNSSELPSEIIIERKSTAPLSKYRKVIMVESELLAQLKEEGKLLLNDDYPESRQLDSYYRLVYTTKDGVLKILPAIFLSRASGNGGVTYGDHKTDEQIFEPAVEVEIPTYEKYGINFKVERVDVNVLLTLSSMNAKIDGEWSIERKSSKPLASFRKVKTILGEDRDAIMNGERVFMDKYPESRQLDSYYRLVVTDKEGKRTEFPALYLQGYNAK